MSHPLGRLAVMQQHLRFDEDSIIDWRLDERTKTVGRQGVALARAVLEGATKVSAHEGVRAAA